MKTRTFTASISQEGEMFIAQCLEIDVASQGKSEDEAVENLKEALELYFEPPHPTVIPKLRKFEVSIDANETDVGEFSFLARLS
jgi:predicted RNase H-like HicB family nuclease